MTGKTKPEGTWTTQEGKGKWDNRVRYLLWGGYLVYSAIGVMISLLLLQEWLGTVERFRIAPLGMFSGAMLILVFFYAHMGIGRTVFFGNESGGDKK